MNREEIVKIVESAIADIVETDRIKISEINEKTPIFGLNGCLDSLGLVSLVVAIEDKLSEKNINITIVSEKAFSKKISPFLTVRTLANFIKELINGQ